MKKRILLYYLFCLPFVSLAQIEDAWVYLADKLDVASSISNPNTILTQKAIDRKATHGIAIDARDVPVNEAYISQLKLATGITVYAKSKWFNAVHVRGTETDINNLVTTYAFVDYVEFADRSLNTKRPSSSKDKFEIEEEMVIFDYGDTQNQVEMISAHDLHILDYTGEGVTIAVMDAGFPNVNTMMAFQKIRSAGDLLGGYDFVNRTSDVYAYTGSDHGTKVLSTMAGFIENQYVGTAPDASYYLFRTEAPYENPVEESFWVEAAERADSLGVDLLNTSLGYKDFFDDSSYDYTASDMDGNTAFITKGANIAFEKGLVLINSSGNNGNRVDYKGVNAPADSPNVLSIGAVDFNGDYVSFSSQGNSFQPTQKPDVVARGASSYVIDDIITPGTIIQNNGTSFSSPILAGGIACLMQALPNKTNSEIYQLVRESASQYLSPDYFLGYGIPNLGLALSLNINSKEISEFKIYPNPVNNNLFIDFPQDFDQVDVAIFDILGKQVVGVIVSLEENVIDVGNLNKGVYIVKIDSSYNSNSFKLIKR